MELKVESRIGQLRSNGENMYGLLADCTNFKQFVVDEKVKNWQADSDSCSFTIDGAGDVLFRIVERRPNDLIKFSIENARAEDMFLWVQMKHLHPADTRVKLTVRLTVNMMLRMLISKPLQQGLNKIVETLEKVCP